METETLYIVLGVIVVINVVLLFMFMSKKKKQSVSRPKTAPNNQVQAVNYNEYNKTVALHHSSPMQQEKQARPYQTNEKTAMLQEEKIRPLSSEDKEEVRQQVSKKAVMETQLLTAEPEVAVDKEPVPTMTIEYKEKETEKSFPFTSSIVNVGRDPEVCDLVLSEDPFIGRNHAMILNKENKFFVVDLESKNGTFIDGERITGQKPIEANQPFTIGRTEMVIKVIGG
ncbi:hypothetical protein BKP45_03315 [Anaerobacillus alkalidiazotrophicus]|uniref:FHA domain-containing protein n=1 Tax=Anaerobacillus alkalidiazotrophicus TaxID=472963 RepID=A0A1S2MAJ0_9BACI|nr:FHA domain-containing protein [Anaerobacillus alkalidiazotrophicus]OIJ21741.1 hypothetical protein BKP45_03315 [Anaerobacillus alkalidiazotrophicus]